MKKIKCYACKRITDSKLKLSIWGVGDLYFCCMCCLNKYVEYAQDEDIRILEGCL